MRRIGSARAIPDEPKVGAQLRMPGYPGRDRDRAPWPVAADVPEALVRGQSARDAPLLGMPADDDWVLYAGYNDLAQRWRELRAGGLRGRVLATVERSRRELRGAAGRTFRRWPVLDRRIWPNPAARGSFRAEVRFLRSWMTRRISWLDARLCARKCAAPRR